MIGDNPGASAGCFSRPPSKDGELDHNHLFLFSLRGFGFGCRDCTRRENYDMDFDTVRDAAADESAAQRWRMEVSTTGAAQR